MSQYKNIHTGEIFEAVQNPDPKSPDPLVTPGFIIKAFAQKLARQEPSRSADVEVLDEDGEWQVAHVGDWILQNVDTEALSVEEPETLAADYVQLAI